ncbi:MAG: HEAT repeat domain-containing protein [Methanothrix sp.]|nr:HEAT repeat domain-containing protein [Methanothrix sp.]MDD4447089.1 HEAT repeat domain-containing protein [Methanothrix sp.]
MIERRYAVLIASSQFEDPNLQKLQCPENDVDGLNKILMSEEYGKFTNTFPLKNTPNHKVQEEIEQVIQTADKDDLIFIYYSGHGKLDRAGKLYLATTNTNANVLKSTSISINFIKELLDGSRTNKIILILDCCYSGLAGEAFARGGIDEELQSLSEVTGTYIITASGRTQAAFEKPEDGYGVFTKHAIEGITSWKAADDEGNVTMESLYSYIYKEMRDERAQTPMKWALNVKGELIIASKNKSKSAIQNKKTTELDLLEKYLANNDLEIRKLAVHVSRKIGLPAIKSLIQALKDDDANIRMETAKALGFIGDIKAIEPLIQTLTDDDNNVREESIEALRKIGVPSIEALAKVLKDRDNKVKKHAVQALGEIRDAKAVESLIQVLNETDSDVLGEAVSALEKIGMPSVKPLIQALKDRDGQVRKLATVALGEIRDVRAVEPLIQVLGDNDSNVRGGAADALSKIRDIRAVEPLIQYLKDNDSDVRCKTALALGRIGDAEASKPLIHALLYDTDSKVRKSAAMALGEIRDPITSGPLIQAFIDTDYQVRLNAAIALEGINVEEISNREALEILVLALKDSDRQIQGSAVRALTNTWAIESLINNLKNEDEIIRQMSVRILGKIRAVEAVESLIQMLRNDCSPAVREEVAIALGDIKDQRAEGPLVRAIKMDDYEQVRDAAVVAIGRII